MTISLNQLRVLLLEDNQAFSWLISEWLEKAGCEVRVVHDLPQAKQSLEQETYDVLLTDIELPSGASFSLIDQLLTLSKTPLSVIVMTSHQRADYAVQALRLKVDDFLFKPFKQEDLIEKLKQSINAKSKHQRRVLAIGAHPDDVELGCGATLAAHAAKGDWVHILTLSCGAVGGDSTERRIESERAAAVIGASLTILNLPDAQMSEGMETITEIEKVIAQHKPQLVYTHSEKDGHQDHRNIYRATLVAARQVPTLMCYQAPSTTVQFIPSLYNDIGSYLVKKQEALAQYASQMSKRPYMQPELIEATARYWGRFAGYSLCEPFEVIRQSIAT